MADFTLVFSTNQDPFELIVTHVENAKNVDEAYDQIFDDVLGFCKDNYSDCEEPFLSYVAFEGLCILTANKPDIVKKLVPKDS